MVVRERRFLTQGKATVEFNSPCGTDTYNQSVRAKADVESSLTHARWEKVAAIAAFALLGVGVVALAINNLGNRYFWTDESSSLYTSLGWPGVGARAGSLSGAWDWIVGVNLEPGLHNVLERYWALGVGTQIFELRSFPFFFFLVYIGSLVGLGWLLRVPLFLIAGVVALMMLENITPYTSVEVRPTSAGLAAAVVLPLLGLLLLKWPRRSLLAAFLLGLLFFGSMQYNSYLVEVALGVVLLAFGVAGYRGAERRILITAGVVTVLWLPIVFVTTRGNPLDSAMSPGLANISASLIPNMEPVEVLSLMQQNFLSPTGLPRTIFLVTLPALWLLHRWPRPTESSSWRVRSVTFLWAFVLLATGVSAVAGFLGVMPWILGTRWSIADIGLIAVSLMGLAAILADSALMNRRSVATAAMVLCVAASAVACYRLVSYERFPGFNWNPALSAVLSGERGKTVVDPNVYTDLRYWVELSGDYDSFQSAWIEHGVRQTSEFAGADASNVEEFLSSTDDRLLLGDASVLEDVGADRMVDVEVVYVPVWNEHDGFSPAQPVVLVKKP